MGGLIRSGPVLFAILLALTACAGPASRDTSRSGGQAAGSGAEPRKVTIAIRGEPRTFSIKIDSSPSVPGGAEVEQLVNAGLTVTDNVGALRPQLAEAVPTVENGLWKLFPDGHMETTWRLRAGASWHDGSPVTSDDLRFTTRVVQDGDLPEFRDAQFDLIESVSAPDSRTVVLRWKQPFIQADAMFSQNLVLPMAQHALEPAYLRDKASFTDSPAWSQEFVGSGPFRLQEWAQGSHMLLAAFDQYVLGRPKLDQIEVRFVEDSNTFAANMMAGAVDMNLGARNLSLEQALQVKEHWSGSMEIRYRQRFVAHPQFMDASPFLISDVRFRRALYHALDRQQMSDTLLPGATSPVAHFFLDPSEPEFKELQSAAIRYDFDQRQSAQLLESLGLSKGPDGMYHGANGEKVTVEIRTVSTDINTKIMYAMADFWQKAGVAVDPVVIPPQRQRDLAWRATFPGFDMERQPSDTEPFKYLYASQSRVAETNYLGRNYSRYMNPALDAMVDAYFTTIPWDQRMDIGRDIVHHITDQVVWMDLFYDAEPMLVSGRVSHVTPVSQGAVAWNAQEWDLN
ncbi:MAG TPA: ABC transporter substrate-binding protein [Chloroflexota bacterium]|nr:ABC transporter substrate-binding protein [Chloroflexota bacterium]